MKPITLEDLVPDYAEFFIKSVGKTLRLRPLNVEDKVWIKRKFGDDVEAALNIKNLDKICIVAYHMIDDKSLFKKQKVIEIDEEGTETESEIGGLKLFMRMLISAADQQSLIDALLKSFGVSKELAKQIEEDQLKKNLTKEEELKPAGEQSLTV